MANTFAVVDMVTKEALRIAHEKTSFIGSIDRQYDDSFKQNGGKIGSTLRVREPNKYTVRTGRVMDVQDQAETSQTITVATQKGVDMRFNSVELIQSVNNGAAFDDLSKNYIAPAVATLMSTIESEMLTYASQATYNIAGTAGTGITTLVAPGAARAKLNQGLAPKDMRAIQMDSVTMGGLVNGMAAYFNPSGAISEQYREGLIARTAMADFYENERVYSHTTGSDFTTVTVNDTAIADGDSTITAAGGNFKKGDVFTFAGVYDVHPETKVAYPHLKQFVVTADGTTSLAFSPALQSTGAKKNCSALPANSAAITFVGAASTSYVQPLMYHKEAFQFITADLPLMDDAQKCVRRVQDGLSVRVWMGSDIRNDELLMRLDILYGMAALRPEWACRMIGSASA